MNGVNENVEKVRAEARPDSGRGDEAEDATDEKARHDIYFVTTNDVLYKFPVDRNGGYTEAPRTPPYSEPNLRHIHNVANPGLTEEPPQPRGPVFATLPVTEEPTAASFAICYVINPNNLIYRNAYTAEEWFASGAKETSGPTIPDDFELIVAGPKGRIYHLEVGKDGKPTSCRKLEHDDLKHEMDLWDQLRNGTVVGRVLFGNKVVPMVNVTSIQPEGRTR